MMSELLRRLIKYYHMIKKYDFNPNIKFPIAYFSHCTWGRRSELACDMSFAFVKVAWICLE